MRQWHATMCKIRKIWTNLVAKKEPLVTHDNFEINCNEQITCQQRFLKRKVNPLGVNTQSFGSSVPRLTPSPLSESNEPETESNWKVVLFEKASFEGYLSCKNQLNARIVWSLPMKWFKTIEQLDRLSLWNRF